MDKQHYDRRADVNKARGIPDPKRFNGEASNPRFNVGDTVRIRDLPDVFYTRSQTYTRGARATVVRLVYETPPIEDEAWCYPEKEQWIYTLVFKQKELWPEYADAYSQDTLETEIPERWLEPV